MEEQQKAIMMIEVGLTRQPREYQSVRCGVTLPVMVQPGDDAQALLQYHLEAAMQTVRAQIDNEYEWGHGKPAPYSAEPRFVVLHVDGARLQVIIPETCKMNLPEAWQRHSSNRWAGHRLSFILRKLEEEYPDFELVDCSDGDLTRLPGLEVLKLYKYSPVHDQEPKLWVLTQDGVKFDKAKTYSGYWNTYSLFRLYDETLWNELEEQANVAGALLFDCLDGDFGGLPTPVVVGDEPDDDTGEDK